MIDPDRALRAYTDVLAVEYDADTEMGRVVTLSDAYAFDARDGLHSCPDREYHDVDHCKHVVAADISRGAIDGVDAGWLVTDDLDGRAEPALLADGGDLADADYTCNACGAGYDVGTDGDAFTHFSVSHHNQPDADDYAVSVCPDCAEDVDAQLAAWADAHWFEDDTEDDSQ